MTEEFRFPVEYQAILNEIRIRFGKGNKPMEDFLDFVEPFLETRDRNLEDHITTLGAGNTFVVIDSTGKGDYRDFDEVNLAHNVPVLYVKAGSYSGPLAFPSGVLILCEAEVFYDGSIGDFAQDYDSPIQIVGGHWSIDGNLTAITGPWVFSGCHMTSTIFSSYHDGAERSVACLGVKFSGQDAIIADPDTPVMLQSCVFGPTADITVGGTTYTELNANGELPLGLNGALDDLADVDAPTPADQDVLTWDAGSSAWIAQAPTGGGGGDSSSDDLTYSFLLMGV